jgi:hypothetical protein
MASGVPLPEPLPSTDRHGAEALTVLLEEWRHIEAGIARYDTLQFQVRGWAISLVVAILAATVTLREPRMALLGILVAILFWWIETLHDSVKSILIKRTRELQWTLTVYLGGGPDLSPLAKPMIAERFEAEWQQRWRDRLPRVLRSSRRMTVFPTYVSLLAVSLACWAVAPSGSAIPPAADRAATK